MYNFQNIMMLFSDINISNISGQGSLDRSVVILGAPGKDGHYNVNGIEEMFLLRDHEALIQMLC